MRVSGSFEDGASCSACDYGEYRCPNASGNIRTYGKPDRRTGEPEGLRDLYHQMHTAKYLPVPTYMVSSGNGLHLYYLLENPLPLHQNIAKELQRLTRELTRKVWNGYIVSIEDSREIQQEGIYQGFRMPGTVTKNGGRAEAFLTG